MPVLEITGLLALAALAWLWLDSLRARDVAIDAARAACAAEGVQLLDATVAISRLALGRDEDGHVQLKRAYDFEFSSTGDNRLRGSIVLLGHRVLVLRIGPQPVPPARTLR